MLITFRNCIAQFTELQPVQSVAQPHPLTCVETSMQPSEQKQFSQVFLKQEWCIGLCEVSIDQITGCHYRKINLIQILMWNCGKKQNSLSKKKMITAQVLLKSSEPNLFTLQSTTKMHRALHDMEEKK